MRKPLLSDDLWTIIEPLLPLEPRRAGCPRPGPRLPDRHQLRAQDRHPVGGSPAGDGLWLGADRLAPLAGCPLGVAGGRRRGAGVPGQREFPGAKGGAQTGPAPRQHPAGPRHETPAGGRPARHPARPLPDRGQPARPHGLRGPARRDPAASTAPAASPETTRQPARGQGRCHPARSRGKLRIARNGIAGWWRARWRG